MNREKVLDFFEKYDFRLGALLFTSAMFFTHAPFFLYIPVPGIEMDTFDYFWFTKQIFDNKIPVQNQLVEIPWGYPLFLYLAKAVRFNLVYILLIQCVIYFLSCIWAIHSFSKFYKKAGLLIGLAFFLFTIQPHTIRHNLTLYSESLYTSALVFIVGGIVGFFKNKNLKSFGVISCGVLFAILIRPNGILLMSIPILLLFYLSSIKYNISTYFLVFVSFMLIDVLGNFYFKGKFSFGESERIVLVFNNFVNKHFLKSNEDDISLDASNKIENTSSSSKEMFSKYFWNFTASKPSFYYSLLPTNYNNLIVNNMPDNTKLRAFDSKVSVDSLDVDLRPFIFQGYNHSIFETVEFSSLLDYNLRKNKWMYLTHILYEFLRKIKLSFVIYLMFWITTFVALFKRFYKFEKSEFHLVILFLALIHFLSLFLLPFMHSRFQLRYIHVTEFIVFIDALLGLYYCFPSIANHYFKRKLVNV